MNFSLLKLKLKLFYDLLIEICQIENILYDWERTVKETPKNINAWKVHSRVLFTRGGIKWEDSIKSCKSSQKALLDGSTNKSSAASVFGKYGMSRRSLESAS